MAAADGRPAGWRLYVPLFVTVVLGLAVTAVAFLLVREWEAREAQAQFEKLVDERRETLQRHIKTDLEVLHSLANFFRGSQKVERAEFRTFVEESFVRHPDIFALQWWPRVLRRERRALERAVRAEGFPNFYIKDAARPDAFVRAPERSEYFPILYSEPQDKDPLALGWDLLPQMQPLWERLLAMQQAAGAASAVASGGVKLYQKERDANDPYAIVLCLPVYRHARVPEDDAGRLRDLRGFVVEILRVRELFENALHGYALPGIDMVLLDETPGATVIELYHHRSRPTPVPDPEAWKQLSGMRWKATVELADRRLSVLYLATPEYQRAHPPWGAWTVSTALMVVLSLTSGFLGTSLRRTQRSQGMARALAEEIAQREHSERSLRENEARLQRQTAALMALTNERVIRYLDSEQALRELTERAAQALDVARIGVWKFSADQSKLECLELYEKDQDRHGAGAELMVAEYPAYVQALKECWGLAAD
ncbi:MAG: CHASE domain-containing protein, partial [Gammaproteobacteria bacterium]